MPVENLPNTPKHETQLTATTETCRAIHTGSNMDTDIPVLKHKERGCKYNIHFYNLLFAPHSPPNPAFKPYHSTPSTVRFPLTLTLETTLWNHDTL